jgi:hypothetical protein
MEFRKKKLALPLDKRTIILFLGTFISVPLIIGIKRSDMLTNLVFVHLLTIIPNNLLLIIVNLNISKSLYLQNQLIIRSSRSFFRQVQIMSAIKYTTFYWITMYLLIYLVSTIEVGTEKLIAIFLIVNFIYFIFLTFILCIRYFLRINTLIIAITLNLIFHYVLISMAFEKMYQLIMGG